MYKKYRVLAVITARGGSKGVKRKAIRMVGDLPLIVHTIKAAATSKLVDRCILSTEDDEIAEIARQHGAEIPFRRPAELAADSTPGIEPLIHAVETLGTDYDYVVLLQPTSPFRNGDDIDNAIRCCIDNAADTCATVCIAEKSPYWMYSIADGHRLKPLFEAESQIARRQDLPAAYALNGAVFVARIEFLLKQRTLFNDDTVGCLMPAERSIDIDSELDLQIADFLASREKNKNG